MKLLQLFESSFVDNGQLVLKQLAQALEQKQDIDLKIGVEMMPIKYWQVRHLLGKYRAMAKHYGTEEALGFLGNYDAINSALDKMDTKLASYKDLGSVPGERAVDEGIMLVSEDSNPMAQALVNRIMRARLDLLSKYGPEAVLQAVEDVTAGDTEWEEIGTSDVSAYLRYVEDYLVDHHGSREEMDEAEKVAMHRPGWMLRADPKLGNKFKEIERRRQTMAKYAGKTGDEIKKMQDQEQGVAEGSSKPPVCKHCGKKQGEHRRGECPKGSKTAVGYTDYGPTKFEPKEPKKQGVSEYGDTAKGQKMLSKVHHRAADRVTSKKADTDPAYARKAQQTQDRAWDRLAVKEQGVSEGHADQQKTIVKRNGQPVGEIGIDRESSPGAGQYYMKHYASGTDNSGYDSREEALDELKHYLKQGVREGSGPKEKQKTPYRDINSPEYRAEVEKRKQRMAKDKAAEPGKKLADKIAKKGVSEGAPELLKQEMPLVRHIEKELEQYGYEKGTPEYNEQFKHAIAMYRKFGNIDAIRKGVAEGFMDTIKGAARELTRDSLQKKIKQAWENTFWPRHIEPALNRIQIDGQPFRRMVLGEPRVIENDRSRNAILKQYTVNIVFPIDPEQWAGDEIRYLEGQLRDIEDGDWNPKVHGLGLVSFDQPMKSFQYAKGRVPDLVIPVRVTSLDINRSLVGEQGVLEGPEFGAYYHEQLAKKLFDANPNLIDDDSILDAGYKIAVQDLGLKGAQYKFNYDEDFVGDFVSAYASLKKPAMAESIKTTYQDPLVVVFDRDGLHTHANLSTVNHIFNIDVKADDVHRGPVKIRSGWEDGRDLLIKISKHNDAAMKKDAEPMPGDVVEGDSMGKHIVLVTVTDPNHPAVSQRKEKFQRRARVSARDRQSAITAAIDFYKRQGLKVWDDHYVGPADQINEGRSVKKKSKALTEDLTQEQPVFRSRTASGLQRYSTTQPDVTVDTQTTSTIADKKHTGGKVAGQVSMTPNAIRKRAARAAKRYAADSTPNIFSRMIAQLTQPTSTSTSSTGGTTQATAQGVIHRASASNPNQPKPAAVPAAKAAAVKGAAKKIAQTQQPVSLGGQKLDLTDPKNAAIAKQLKAQGEIAEADRDRELRDKIETLNKGRLKEGEKKPKPTNPQLWGRAKSAAKSKFDVYPSAYANAWAAKWYKQHGGGWR